jgi:hypothetical protein
MGDKNKDSGEISNFSFYSYANIEHSPCPRWKNTTSHITDLFTSVFIT